MDNIILEMDSQSTKSHTDDLTQHDIDYDTRPSITEETIDKTHRKTNIIIFLLFFFILLFHFLLGA